MPAVAAAGNDLHESMTAFPSLAIVVLLGWFAAAPAPMTFTTLARGDRSGIEEPREVVVRTAAQWSALWKEHAGTGAPPAVDFTRSMVVAVFAGSRPTAGFAVEITEIERQDTKLVVSYAEHAPAPDQVVAQVLTSPFHLVRTQVFSGPVTFRRTH